MVSGHAGNVGVVSGHVTRGTSSPAVLFIGQVGWSLGGGHGQLVGVHGLGVDQVLEVEMVIADGSVVVANTSGTLVTQAEGGLAEWSEDTELFWAVRGGGAGPWGVVTGHPPHGQDAQTQAGVRGVLLHPDHPHLGEQVGGGQRADGGAGHPGLPHLGGQQGTLGDLSPQS